MMSALVIAGPLGGWFALFGACLGGPRLGHAGRHPPLSQESSAAPPAVMALLADHPDRDGFAATLLDLAARGWFSLSRPHAEATPAICVLPAETPIEQLTPYERRAVTHVAQRTGAQPEIPADALMDGFEGGEDLFLSDFRHEVLADARHRGLTRPTLSTRRKALLCLLALIPAGAALVAGPVARRESSLVWPCVVGYLVLCGIAASVGSERLTLVGQLALRQSRPGTGKPAVASFTPASKNVVWSGYADSWRLLPIGDSAGRMWPGISAGAFAGICLLTIPGIPLLSVLGYFLAGGRGVELGLLAGAAAVVTVTIRAAARWSHLPRFVEFDGLVLRQWQTGTQSDDDGIEYFVAVDDGSSAQAWAFNVGGAAFRRLPPGTLVHAKVDPRLNKLLDIQPLRRLPSAPRLADAVDPRAPHG